MYYYISNLLYLSMNEKKDTTTVLHRTPQAISSNSYLTPSSTLNVLHDSVKSSLSNPIASNNICW
jgi:hypothetical protein